MTTEQTSNTACPPPTNCATGSRAALRRGRLATSSSVSPARTALPASTPITGDVLFTVPETTAEAGRAPSPKRRKHLRHGAPRPRRCAAHWWPGSANCSTEHKADLATLVTIEAGKITSEALGEVQEMIDICRVRRRAVAPAVRPHHRLRAARATG